LDYTDAIGVFITHGSTLNVVFKNHVVALNAMSSTLVNARYDIIVSYLKTKADVDYEKECTELHSTLEHHVQLLKEKNDRISTLLRELDRDSEADLFEESIDPETGLSKIRSI
jgi:hypothetical protein